jgi:threonine synthase
VALGTTGGRLYAVQTEGCAPLAGAWTTTRDLGGTAMALTSGRPVMRPWSGTPRSTATGLLDDETYDWLTVVAAIEQRGGDVVVVTEATLAKAVELARRCTGVPVDATGAAGLAGLLSLREQAIVETSERAVVVFSGGASGGR